MTSPGPVKVLARRSTRIGPYWPGPVAPAVRTQKQIVPRVELKSAFGASVIWLPAMASNCITPLRVMGTGAVSVTDAAQLAPTFTPLCVVPDGLESTMTLAEGAASKLKRTTMDVTATRLAPDENPTPVTPFRQAPSANGSLMSAPAQG